jgi:hypothetical protein
VTKTQAMNLRKIKGLTGELTISNIITTSSSAIALSALLLAVDYSVFGIEFRFWDLG